MKYILAPDRLETPEFVIRSYQPGDGALLNEAVISSYDHLKTFMPWAKTDITLAESEQLCREFRGKYLLSQEFVMGIFSPTGDRLLGGTGYHFESYSIEHLTAEIGMWIRSDMAGQGLGTKVLIELLKWGFEEWPWLKTMWRCNSINYASAAVAHKAGMPQEAILRQDAFAVDGVTRRDTILFGLTKEGWLAANGG